MNNASSILVSGKAARDIAHRRWSHALFSFLWQVLRDQYGVTCFLGLTATATQSTALDIARHLCIPTEDDATIRGSSVPHNLYLSVSRDKSKEEVRIQPHWVNFPSHCCFVAVASKGVSSEIRHR